MRAYSTRLDFQLAAKSAGAGAACNVEGLARLGIQVVTGAVASPSLSPSASASISPSGSASPSSSASISPSASASASPSGSASPSASVSPSASASSGAGVTIWFEASIDGLTWVGLAATPASGATAVTSTTVDGIWLVNVGGLSLVRCRIEGTPAKDVTITGLGTVASA
jgi:hypothetical protein